MLGLATEYFACWPGVLPLYSGYVRMVFSFMNLFRNDRPTSAAIADRPSLRRDLLVLAAVPLLTFALSSAFQLNEWIGSLTGPREAYQADELPLTLLALAVGLASFSWRRSRQMMEQVALRLDSEEQYRMLFTENLAANLLASLDGRIKLANPAAVRLLDFASPDELNGRLLQEFYVDRALGVTHREALQLTRRDGAVVHAAAKLSARLSPAREPELHIYLADMTDVTAMQGQLANALQENRRLSQRS